MGWHLGRPNCVHLDNFRRCRVHTMPAWIRWFIPKVRPACILDGQLPQDGELTCPDQKPRPRPAPPSPSRFQGTHP